MKLDRILELLKLMESHGLAELEVEDKDFRVRLRKDAPGGSPQPAANAAGAGGVEQTPAGAADHGDHHAISSPIVGSFYRAPTPEAEPFVEVGDPVEADTVMCIVEAMKVMNEVRAEVSGTVEMILVENGRPVEYGQPLFLVARS